MRKIIALFILAIAFKATAAQKIEGIYFNLYTDSLKKGFYNYISIDARYADGSWQPLDSSQIIFTSNTGFFKGNDLFIDSSYTGDTVRVRATLKSNPSVWKETIIYIRKRGFDEPLKSNEDILNELRQGRKKPRQRLA